MTDHPIDWKSLLGMDQRIKCEVEIYKRPQGDGNKRYHRLETPPNAFRETYELYKSWKRGVIASFIVLLSLALVGTFIVLSAVGVAILVVLIVRWPALVFYESGVVENQ